MGLDSNLTSDIPMLVALIILFIGLYFRGLVLWISLAIALLYLYIFDRESIITLVIYGFTASLLIAGYLRIRKGLTLSAKPENENQFDLVIDANNLIGTANWDLKVFLKFINELERDGFKTYLFFDHSIIRLLREKGLITELTDYNSTRPRRTKTAVRGRSTRPLVHVDDGRKFKLGPSTSWTDLDAGQWKPFLAGRTDGF